MDLLRSEKTVSATSIEKPGFQMSFLIASTHEASVTLNPRETSFHGIELAASMARGAREGCPTEEKGLQTLLSEAKVEQ